MSARRSGLLIRGAETRAPSSGRSRNQRTQECVALFGLLLRTTRWRSAARAALHACAPRAFRPPTSQNRSDAPTIPYARTPRHRARGRVSPNSGPTLSAALAPDGSSTRCVVSHTGGTACIDQRGTAAPANWWRSCRQATKPGGVGKRLRTAPPCPTPRPDSFEPRHPRRLTIVLSARLTSSSTSGWSRSRQLFRGSSVRV